MAPYIVRGIAGLASPDRPIAAFFLMGLTGSGKTKTPEALARVLQGSEKHLIRVNCGEFQSDHEVAKFTGAPPGYLGFADGASVKDNTVFTNQALSNAAPNYPKLPIVIFDEVEKASPAVGRVLLSILDKAELRLGNGQSVDFSKCIIFFTSNVGAKEMQTTLNNRIGFADQPTQSTSKVALSAFTRHFSPELINRIDEVIVYDMLTPEVVVKIAELELIKSQQYIGGKFTLSYENDTLEWLAKVGYSPSYGARELKRTIDRYILNPLADACVNGKLRPGSVVKCKAGQSAITFEYVQRTSCEAAVGAPACELVGENKPAQQAIDDELGEEIEFVKEFLWMNVGSIPTVIKKLQNGSVLANILNGRVRYESGGWAWRGLNPAQATPEECNSLAKHFKAAANKLYEIGSKVRCGFVDDAMRHRLERYRLLARGGTRGRWMCDGLAVEMEKIGNQLG